MKSSTMHEEGSCYVIAKICCMCTCYINNVIFFFSGSRRCFSWTVTFKHINKSTYLFFCKINL